MSLQGYVFCKMCKKSDLKRDKGLTIPRDIEYIKDIRYGKNKKYHILDICWPKYIDERLIDCSKDKLPVIINVHGGGYVYGNKEVYQYYAANLAQKGFVVINYNYRLAPRYKFPAPLEDLNEVIKWSLEHQDDYPVDMENVFLIGDSAGAQIACQYGCIYSNSQYERIMEITKPKVTIKALSLACGMYDLKKRIVAEGKTGVIRDYLTANPERFGEKLDIIEHITGNFPPVFLFTAKGDFLMEECQPMAELLESKGVQCEYKIYGNEQTGHVFHVDMRNEYSTIANQNQTEFFKRIMSDCYF